ncbi:MAG: GNAT family N-acetyltransferase [Verrucomicrobia bacterium]|nr:GNAT family N-acetyltransferase [Verrucomicrobiota bacterium]
MNLTWRLANLTDVDLLAELNQELIQDEGGCGSLALPQLSERMRNWLQNGYRGVLFAETDDVVAYALYCFAEKAEGDRFIFLRHFYVQRARRRKGIGREAVRLLLSEVLPPGSRILLDVLFENQVGREFWRNLGFKEHCLTLEWQPSCGEAKLNTQRGETAG